MKKTTWIIWVSLAVIGLLLGSRAVAQQPMAIQPESALLQQPEEYVPCEPCESSICLDGGTCDACALGPCCAVCGGGSCCPDDWYFKQGVRVLGRNRTRGVPLTYEMFSVNGWTKEDGKDAFVGYGNLLKANTLALEFDGACGYVATFGHYLGRDTENRDQFLECSYWGPNQWTDSFQVKGYRADIPESSFSNSTDIKEYYNVGSLNSPFDFIGNAEDSQVGGFNRADEHTFFYQCDMNNFEVNVRLCPRARGDRLVLHPNGKWRRECLPGNYISYVFGMRFISIHERFNWNSRGVIEKWSRPTSDGEFTKESESLISGDYLVRTRNDLFGLQVGCDYTFRNCKWQWGVRAKMGPYLNLADQRSTIVTTGSAGDPFADDDLNCQLDARKNVISLVGEVGFHGSYKIRPNLAMHAGYDFMWITSLAMAPEQLVYTRDPNICPPSQITTDGHIYAHGLTLELEWMW